MEPNSVEKSQSESAAGPDMLPVLSYDRRWPNIETLFGAKNENLAVIVLRNPILPAKPYTICVVRKRVARRPIWVVRQNCVECPGAVRETKLSGAPKSHPQIPRSIFGDRRHNDRVGRRRF